MNDIEFLNWINDRLVHVYKEIPNVYFVLRLGNVIKRFEYLEKDFLRLQQKYDDLQTLEKGYKVIPETKPLHDLITEDEEDKIREAHDRWKDKSE